MRNVARTAAVTLMRGVAHWRAGRCRRGHLPPPGHRRGRRGRRRHRSVSATCRWRPSGVCCSWASRWSGATILVAGDGPAYTQGRARADAGRRARAGGGARKAPAASASTAARRPGTASVTRPPAAASPRPTPWCSAPARRDERTVGPGALDRRGPLAAAAPHLAVVSQAGEPDRRGLAGAGLRLLARRRRRRALRPSAAAAHRAPHSRAQGRRGHDPRPSPRLVAAGGRAARRGRGARRAAAQGSRRAAALDRAARRRGPRRGAPSQTCARPARGAGCWSILVGRIVSRRR